MENAKTIKYLFLFLLLFFLSCEKNAIHYFNRRNQEILKPAGLRNIKLNLYTDSDNNLFIISDNNIFYDDHDTIKMKTIGLLLSDSIVFEKDNSIKNISRIIDTISYQEVIKDLIYKDKNHIYFNRGSEYLEYPYYILDLFPEATFFMEGNYVKDNHTVYYYGGIHCIKLDSVDINTFKTLKIDGHLNQSYYLGIDKNYIYDKGEIIGKQSFDYLNIDKEKKDSLKQIYFFDD